MSDEEAALAIRFALIESRLQALEAVVKPKPVAAEAKWDVSPAPLAEQDFEEGR